MKSQMIRILCNSGSNSCRGAGMSTRPEFYSGRGVGSDVTARQLVLIYQELQVEKTLPEKAAEGFLKMVVSMPELTGTAFVRNLHQLDGNDFKWEEGMGSDNNIEIEAEDGTNARQLGAMATVFSMMGEMGGGDKPKNRRLTAGIKAEFLRMIGRSDLTPKNPDPWDYCDTWGIDPSGRYNNWR